MENNTNEEDFFDKSEIRRAGRHAEDMDTSFVEPKKHHFFLGFFIFLLLVIIGGACAYYFVLDTPKKTYLTLLDKLTKDNPVISENTNNDINYNYSISTNLLSNDKETQQVLDIINKIDLTGTTKYENNILKGTNNIKYNKEELLDITYRLDLSNPALYIKLNKVLDKVIKLDVNTTTPVTSSFDNNKDDYIKLFNLVIKNFKLSLENANFERKITKLNNNFVFKETLFLDETLEKELLTKLIHDDEFLQTYAKINGYTVTEASDELNEELANLEPDKSTITVYKTILKNELQKVELIDEDNNFIITKEDNKYNYEIVEKNELLYKGYVKVDKNNNETKEAINIELIKEKISLEVNMTYSKNTNSIEELDPKKAISTEKLTEEDVTKIMQYLQENKTVKSLLDDLGLTERMNEINNM